MTGLFSKISTFARSPQGQKLIQQDQAAARYPENRTKDKQSGDQLRLRRRDSRPTA